MRRFGAHANSEYFRFIEGDLDSTEVCSKPIWTSSSQADRIKDFGGFEEVCFYNLLCSYTHQSIPNERLIKHPNEIFVLRTYFLGKIIKYLNNLAVAVNNKGGTGNIQLDLALKNYAQEMDFLINDWNKLLAELFEFSDHNHVVT